MSKDWRGIFKSIIIFIEMSAYVLSIGNFDKLLTALKKEIDSYFDDNEEV
jgi:hypothetical protein